MGVAPCVAPSCFVTQKLTSNKGFMTTEEVLEYLQVNLRTVYRLIKTRNIPAIRVGRQWRFRRGDIEAWLDSQRATTAAQTPMSGARQKGRLHLLIVDDEQSGLDLLTKMLASDYTVVPATDATVALEMLRANTSGYDMLISDLNMPTMDGLTLIREVRRISPRLPIAIITGFSTESSAIEAVNLGVGGYLVKPFRAAEVQAVVARALSVPAA
jgi:excisionase family DNA binding protein